MKVTYFSAGTFMDEFWKQNILVEYLHSICITPGK